MINHKIKYNRKKSAIKKQASTITSKNAKKNIKSTSYQDYLLGSLQDPEEASGYLNAALAGGDIKVFLLALQNVVKASGGVSAIAEKADKSRTSLYKTLSENGNPHLKHTNDLLSVMGMQLAILPKIHHGTRLQA